MGESCKDENAGWTLVWGSRMEYQSSCSDK